MDLLSLALVIVAFGIALIYVAKFARQKNEQLRREGIADFRAVVSTPPANKRWLAIQFFGPQPRIIEKIGRFLAAAVAIIVVVSILGIIIAGVIVRL